MLGTGQKQLIPAPQKLFLVLMECWSRAAAGNPHCPWGQPLGTVGMGHRPVGGCSFCRIVETASFFSCVVALRYSWSSSLSKMLSSGRSWSSTGGAGKSPSARVLSGCWV